MPKHVSIGLIGDHDPEITAHRAIPIALQLAADANQVQIEFTWLATEHITHASLQNFSGFWCAPGSPYRSTAGALLAIRHTRENNLPFLGTCGGFQHALLEYAINVLGWRNAEHAETSPDAPFALIATLACALVEASQPLSLAAGSQLARIYGDSKATETYRCRYGLNRHYEQPLFQPPLMASAHDENGEIRAIELSNHPFFIATLFQPERAALAHEPVLLANALIAACCATP